MTNCILHIKGQTFVLPLQGNEQSDDALTQHVLNLVSEWEQKDHFEIGTSGSTGTPKLIRHAKRSIIESAKATAQFFELSAGTKALCALPLSKIAGRMMLYRSIINHWELTVQEPNGNPLSNHEPYDFVALTPFQAQNALANHPAALNFVGKLILGGAKVQDHLVEMLQKSTCNVWETYGMTETITHIAARQLSPTMEPDFTCLPSIEIRTTANGQLCIAAPYFDEVITNDLVELTSNSTFHFLGRSDYVINSGGLKLFPETIESKIAHVIPFPFYIWKTEHPTLGEAVKLVIESRAYTANEQAALHAALSEALDKFEVPKIIEFKTSLSLTESGKIIRE